MILFPSSLIYSQSTRGKGKCALFKFVKNKKNIFVLQNGFTVALFPFLQFFPLSKLKTNWNWRACWLSSQTPGKKNWLVKRYSDWPKKLEPENIFVAISSHFRSILQQAQVNLRMPIFQLHVTTSGGHDTYFQTCPIFCKSVPSSENINWTYAPCFD